MTPRPAQPEPFVRGAPYPAAGDVPYPRANPTDTARLPSDTWHAATVPAGVRLELVGDAQAIDVAYRTTSGNLGYRGDGAGITFSVWRAGRKVSEEEAVLGDGLIRLSLGSAAPVALTDGKLTLRIVVDGDSVEVFAGDGKAVISSLVFPAAGDDDVALFAGGGKATAENVSVTQLGG